MPLAIGIGIGLSFGSGTGGVDLGIGDQILLLEGGGYWRQLESSDQITQLE